MLQIKPYAKAPADGEVAGGSSFVDEAMITGESAPVAKRAGSPIISGAQLFKFKVSVRGFCGWVHDHQRFGALANRTGSHVISDAIAAPLP